MARMSAHTCYGCHKPIVTSARVIGDVGGRNQHFHRVCWRTWGQTEPEPEPIAPNEEPTPETAPEPVGAGPEAAEGTAADSTPAPSPAAKPPKAPAQKTPAKGKPANRGKR